MYSIKQEEKEKISTLHTNTLVHVLYVIRKPISFDIGSNKLLI